MSNRIPNLTNQQKELIYKMIHDKMNAELKVIKRKELNKKITITIITIITILILTRLF